MATAIWHNWTAGVTSERSLIVPRRRGGERTAGSLQPGEPDLQVPERLVGERRANVTDIQRIARDGVVCAEQRADRLGTAAFARYW
jgi:transcription termination factor Rho